MTKLTFLGHLNLVCIHSELENQAVASWIQTRFAYSASEPALESSGVEVVTADQLSAETVELVEKIVAVDFEAAFQR
jgi:hypothetical protein